MMAEKLETKTSGVQVLPKDANDNELTFFTSVDKATKEWLVSLHHLWQLWKKCDVINDMLTDYFNSAPNPYLSTLRIVANASDFKQIKVNSSLSYTVIEEFAKWLEPRKDLYEHLLVTDLKLAAFKLIIKQNNMQFIKLVANTYEFVQHRAEFLHIIEDLIKEQKYKEVAQYGAMLKLQNFFPNLENVLVPLILQNKLNIVEEFLTDSPEIQKSLIQYLDNLLSPDNNMQVILDNLIDHHKIPDVKISTVQTKPIAKLVTRLVKLYNFPPEICPNVNKKRSEGILNFLIHKRYVDGSLNPSSWREMVEEAVGTDKKLQAAMIRLLLNSKDSKEALYWAKKFDIPKEQWPWVLTYTAENTKDENDGASTSVEKESDWEETADSLNYHELKLHRDCIKVVNTLESFAKFIDNGLKDVHIVGIDSEWKPSFGTKQPDLALIQIATETNVYILDVISIGHNSSECWAQLGPALFENKNILKLGFGISHDMTIIHDSLPALSHVKTYGQGYIDIVELWKKLVNEYKFVFPHENDQHLTKNSLSKLVELCLGKKINKSDQFSNWENRPLRESQLKYAALDAYCLLEVYKILENQSSQLGIPFHDICMEVQHGSQKFQKKNTKKPFQKAHPFAKEPHNLPKQENFHNNESRLKFVPNEKKYLSLNDDTNRLPHPNRFTIAREQNMKMMYYENTRSRNQLQTPYSQTKIPAHKWAVVCDSMLGGLSAKLRLCGCDSNHLVFDQGGERAVKMAISENRVFLTRNKDYLKFSPYLPPGRSYFVQADNPYEQLREVLNYFGVSVMKRNIFSRCQACNSNEFAKITRRFMDKLMKSFDNFTDATSTNDDSKHELYVDNYVKNNSKPNVYRTWILSTNSVNAATCSTKYHVRIQIENVPVNVLKNLQIFYVCERCGKIYWDGSHLERTLNGAIQDLIVHV
ncbi:exonuclease mut-7 homolog [Calliopsis andreniformis]|uniref:exonuclease mut-7 homolog n=1 Tax=Calliopsis andreniformis TaxID=337506 RepID=UPI003FCCF9B3